MKLKFVLLLLLIVQSVSLSQAIRSVGVIAGTTSASQSWHYAPPFTNLPTQHRWGLDIGVVAEWLNLPALSVLSEIHYVQKGMKLSIPITTEEHPDGTGEEWTQSPRLDYLSIPLLGKARAFDKDITPYIVAGPRLDFLLQTRGEGFEVIFDKFQKVDFGATVGVGLEVRSFERLQLGIEFRFSPSFKDGYSSAFTKVRNNSIELLLVAGTSAGATAP